MPVESIPKPGTWERAFYDIDCCIRGLQVVLNNIEAYAETPQQRDYLTHFCKIEIDVLLEARSSLKKLMRHWMEGFDNAE